MAGEVRIKVGAAHAAKMNPQWMGIQHFIEHLILFGASRNYAPNEVQDIISSRLFFYHNARTSITDAAYFTSGSLGHVFPSHNFWAAFEAITDGIYFPKFDTPSIEGQRLRVLNEITQYSTPLEQEDRNFYKLMYGPEYLGYNTLGTKEQVEAYTFDDFERFHQGSMTLQNTTISITGDVVHGQAVEKVENTLAGAISRGFDLPVLEEPYVQRGEYRRRTKDTNKGFVEISLNFPAPNIADRKFSSAYLAMMGLSKTVQQKIFSRFGLYTAFVGYDGFFNPGAKISLCTNVGEKEKSTDVLNYALDIMQDSSTSNHIAEMHGNLVAHTVNDISITQSTVESEATWLNNLSAIGAALPSYQEKIAMVEDTTPDELVESIKTLNASHAFLNARGHADALDTVPSIDVIDSWRSLPKYPASVVATGQPTTPPPVSTPRQPG